MFKTVSGKKQTLFYPLIFWVVGILFSTFFIATQYHYIIGIVLFGVLLFRKRERKIILLLVIFLLGWFYSSSRLDLNQSNIGYYLKGNRLISELFTYRVDDKKLTKKGKIYYQIGLKTINDRVIKGKLLLYSSSSDLEVGGIYSSLLKVERISGAHNPGEFDFHKYYKYRGIDGRCMPFSFAHKIGYAPTFSMQLREHIREKISSIFSERRESALALFLGDKSGLALDSEQLSRLGLLHLFAVSGLHVGIIYLVLYSLLSVFFSRMWARFITSLLLIFYAIICSWSPSVTRTVIFILIYNSSLLLERKVSFKQIISITLFVITLMNPLEIFSVGLQLSFTAFFALWFADRVILSQEIILSIRKKVPS